MNNNFLEDISSIIEDYKEDFKFKIGDTKLNIEFDFRPTFAYDYLVIDSQDEYSFHNPEFHNKTCEDYPDKSDFQIYFEKAKSICSQSLQHSLNSHYTNHFRAINNPNKNLLAQIKKIFNRPYLRNEEIPQLGEFALYTNEKGNKAPRIFFFIGNFGIIYILFYDPFHQIFPRK